MLSRRLAIVLTTVSLIGAATLGGWWLLRPTLPTTLGIPAYQYPALGDMWERLRLLPPRSIVVLNPANGPGDTIDPAYQEALAGLAPRRVAVYGYVDTAYGRRSADDIVEDAVRHADLYRPTGIFLDQTVARGEGMAVLVEVVDRLHRLGYRVALNPGQMDIDPAYGTLGDLVVNFEGPLSQYRKTEVPAWVKEVPSKRWWHLVYGAKAEDLDDTLEMAGDRNAGVVFVTDGAMPNPWDRLPDYWRKEVERFGD